MILGKDKKPEENPGDQKIQAPTMDAPLQGKQNVKATSGQEELRVDIKNFAEKYNGVFNANQTNGTICDLLLGIYDELRKVRELMERIEQS